MSNDVQTLSDLLVGSTLVGFSYGTGFTLRFERARGRSKVASSVPTVVEVNIAGECLLGGSLQWTALLRDFPVRTTEPSEPLLAALLVQLRWDGGMVEHVHLLGADLGIAWENGSVLTALADPSGMGPDWSVYEAGVPEPSRIWSVVSEAGIVSSRRP